MAEFTIPEFFEKIQAECSEREWLPFLLLATTFPHGPNRPRFHCVFPEPIPLTEQVDILEMVVEQLKRRVRERN